MANPLSVCSQLKRKNIEGEGVRARTLTGGGYRDRMRASLAFPGPRRLGREKRGKGDGQGIGPWLEKYCPGESRETKYFATGRNTGGIRISTSLGKAFTSHKMMRKKESIYHNRQKKKAMP